MYTRLTDGATKVMKAADKKAQELHHESITADHILLAICEEQYCVAGNVLSLMIEDGRGLVANEIRRLMPKGPEEFAIGKPSLGESAKRILSQSLHEADDLRHNYAGTEHLMLAVLCENEKESLAVAALRNVGFDPLSVRGQITSLLYGGKEATAR